MPDDNTTSLPASPGSPSFSAWQPLLSDLCQDLARLIQDTLRRDSNGLRQGPGLDRIASRGKGDVTFGIDLPAEQAIADWQQAIACCRPISVMTEDVGWRHLLPDGKGGWQTGNSFDHGGPRIAFDPIDGTRNLMANLRSAWTVVSFAGPGSGQPRFRDLTGGIVSELPTTRESTRRELHAQRGQPCLYRELSTHTGHTQTESVLAVDNDDRPDNGYFPFFRYEPALRPAIAQIETSFLNRLVQLEAAEEGTLFDDQYITNAGQMVLLSLGTYRIIVDARPLIAHRLAVPATTAKPYDVAGAFLVAEAAGAVIKDPLGLDLDFPIDCTTPISFAGWANRQTYERLSPHLLSVLHEGN